MFLWRDCLEVREEGIRGLSGRQGGGTVFGDREPCGGACGIRLSAAGERAGRRVPAGMTASV